MVIARNTKIYWFIALLLLVISSNVLLYRLDVMKPLPHGAALGSLVDFMIVIPFLTYFFIIRKRFSIKYIFLVVLAGYGAAFFIIPQGYLSSYSFIRYIILAVEGSFFLLELYIVFKLITKLPAIFKAYKNIDTDIPAFSYRMEQALNHHMNDNRFIKIFLTDITMFYYSLFSWRKKPVMGETIFSSHKKTSSIALYIMIIHALVLESIGFHFLLHSWNEIVAYIALVLNVYTLIFVLGEIQAIRLSPIMITNEKLFLQVGIMQRLTVPLQEIKSIHYYQGPEKLSNAESKTVFNAVLPDFMKEKPSIEIELLSTQEAKMMYGFTKKVKKIHLRPDEPNKFLETLQSKLTEKSWK